MLPFLIAGISFEHSLARLELLLPELQKAVGTPLRASTALRDERLLISWHEKPASDLLKDIAVVCSAEWEQDGEGLKLVRSISTDRKLANAAFAFRVAQLRKDLASRKPLPQLDAKKLTQDIDAYYRTEGDLSSLGNDTLVSRDRARSALFRNGPAARLAQRIAQILPPERYADLVDDERRVFSTRPTAAQVPLGPEYEALLADFCRENDQMGAAATGVKRDRIWSGDPTADYRPVKPAELVVEVSVITYWSMRPYQLMVTIRKPREDRFYGAHTEVVGYGMESPFAIDDQTPYEPLPLPTHSDANLRLHRPDLFDPTADYVTDLPRLAALHKRDLVARVDDEMGAHGAFLRYDRGTNPRKVLTIGQTFGQLLGEEHSIRDDGATLLVAPLDEPAHRRNDCDRRDLAALVSSSERDGFASLETAGVFAQRNGKKAFAYLGARFVNAVCPGAGTTFGGLDVETLRLFGALSPVQRAGVLRGASVPIGNLPPAARIQASKLVFNMRSRHHIDDDEWISQASENAPREFARMPPGAVLTGSDIRQPIMASLSTTNGREYRTVQDAANLGFRVGLAEGQGRPFDPISVFTKVIPGERRLVTLKIVLNAKRTETLSLKEDRFPAKAKPVSYADLPEAFRRSVQVRASAQVRAMRDSGVGAKNAAP